MLQFQKSEEIRSLKFFSEIRSGKFIWKNKGFQNLLRKKIRGLKILGFSQKNTPGGYSPLKMTAPLVQQY